MSLSKEVTQESWDFLVDLSQMPHNQNVKIHDLNLALKRKIKQIGGNIDFCFDRANGFGRDMYLVVVNSKEDTDKIRGLKLEFKSAKANQLK